MLVAVTGGSSGIGKAICCKFRDEGWKVVNISRRLESKDGEPLTGVEFHRCDVVLVERLCKILKRYQVDVLVNNVGILPLKGLLEITLEDWDEILDVNLRAAVFATKTVLPGMMERRFGVIVNIASITGLYAAPGVELYGITKAGLINFTQSITAEYGQYGIRAICICPGFVDTKLVGDGELPQPMLETIPAGRVAKPEEVAELVWMVTKLEYLNGATITFDGGRSHGVWRWKE